MGLNRRHQDFQSCALPTELPAHQTRQDNKGAQGCLFDERGDAEGPDLLEDERDDNDLTRLERALELGEHDVRAVPLEPHERLGRHLELSERRAPRPDERGALVALERAPEIFLGVERRDPAVVRRTVDAVVQQGAAEQVVEASLARPVEAGEAGLALERHVVDRRLAVAGAGHADALHDVAETAPELVAHLVRARLERDRKSTRLNSSHLVISYAVFCLKKKKKKQIT